MSIVKKLQALSIEEYLAGENNSDVRHEYVSGAIYAMVGVNTRHNLLCMNLSTALQNHLQDTACFTFQSDMKVRIDDVFYYPDILVTCGEIDLSAYYQDNPKIIIEVLSESTESKDRLEKRVAYQKISALSEYVLVAQNKISIEIYRRQQTGWEHEVYSQDDTIHFKSIDLLIPASAIYQSVIKL